MNQEDIRIANLINHMFEALEETDDENLTKWEQDFIASIQEQWSESGRLSVKQREILERIYTEKTK